MVNWQLRDILTGAARHLVQFFRQSGKAMHALKSKYRQNRTAEEAPSVELVMDCPTRWNSTYEMIQRLCKHQWVIRQVLNDTTVVPRKSASHLELRDQHWLQLQKLVELLQPLKVILFA